jgi:hypothetical protein
MAKLLISYARKFDASVGADAHWLDLESNIQVIVKRPRQPLPHPWWLRSYHAPSQPLVEERPIGSARPKTGDASASSSRTKCQC